MKKIIVILLFAIFITACGGGGGGIGDLFECNCDDEIEDLTENYGAPEDLNKYDSGNYHSYTYWYWCKGFSETFTWGSSIKGCCKTSTYTFSPICYQ